MSRLLIIEDDEAIANLEKDYLSLSGHAVDICDDGTKGVQMALEEDYDLFIIDIMLPGMDGFEICRRIRSEKETPILMVSARKEDFDKIRGLGMGADDYITKPFSPGELVARVDAHLKRYERLVAAGAEGSEQLMEVRDLKINKKAYIVNLRGEEIKLTGKEMELLLCLVENPGRVLSKEEIFENIWRLDAVGDIATVTVHIKKLREKLEVDPANPQYIETVWGVGYRFKV